MDPISAVGAVIGVLTFAGTIFGVVKGYGALQQKAKDTADDLLDQQKRMDGLEARVEKAEVAAAQTERLADAMEHMGEKFAAEIKRLGDIWSLNHEHTRSQLEKIEGQLSPPRRARP